jgi:uncharacterized protein (TIGR03437 family)
VRNTIAFAGTVVVKIGSTSVNASFAGLVGVGLFQINFTVPSVPDGEYPLSIQVGSQASQTGVIIPIAH